MALCWLLIMFIAFWAGHHVGCRRGAVGERVFRIESERRIIAIAADMIQKARAVSCRRCRRRRKKGGCRG